MPRKNDRVMAGCVLAFIVMAAAGCGKKEGVSPPNAPRAAAGTKAPVQPRRSSVLAPQPQERFDFSRKRDPFRSYMVASKANIPLPQISHTKFPIQQYETSQFKVLGIITGLSENRAMVQDPAGKTYVITPGGVIGPHNGRVLRIRQNAIEITEQYRDESGRVRNRVANLTLPRKE